MTTALSMPDYVHDSIMSALDPLGITPHKDTGDALMYKLEYASGLELSVGIVCVELRKYLILRQPAIGIIIAERDEAQRVREHHGSQFLAPPKSEYDINFHVSILAKFTAMTRAVADSLGAGECMTMTGRDTRAS